MTVYSELFMSPPTLLKLKCLLSEIQFKLSHPKSPESVCSLPCDLGQAKKYVEGESCCWHCFNCTQYQVRRHNIATTINSNSTSPSPFAHSIHHSHPDEKLTGEAISSAFSYFLADIDPILSSTRSLPVHEWCLEK